LCDFLIAVRLAHMNDPWESDYEEVFTIRADP
jgi:hypothetical protein